MNKQIKQRINNLEDELAALKAELEVPEEEPMIECSEGEYYLDTYNEVCNGTSGAIFKVLGAEYVTEKEAEQAAKLRTQLEIINNIIRQLNKKDGFVADWINSNQMKYCIRYNYFRNIYNISSGCLQRRLGTEYCSEKSAVHLVDMVNKGLIRGVDDKWEV